MALGDVISEDGRTYVIVWDGRRGSFSLLGPRDQRGTQIYETRGDTRRPLGSERRTHKRQVRRSEES